MAYGGNIGDPWNNWQPHNPFLEMLAALDGPDGAARGHDVEILENQQRRTGNIKLPDFLPQPPGIWFARAELHFKLSGVDVGEGEVRAHGQRALSRRHALGN